MNLEKTSQELGRAVHEFLVARNVETPAQFLFEQPSKEVEKSTRLAISSHVEAIMKLLNLDLKDDSLFDTPNRVAKMFTQELYYGLNYANFPKCTTVKNKFEADEMVTVKNIKSMSTCEHHLVTIDGIATVSYIPNAHGSVLGLSKINRVVDFFSRRPQVQERLTSQIFYALEYILETENIAVYIDATHYCVKARGVQDNSRTSTIKLGGVFKTNPSVKEEFLKHCKG